MKKESELTVFFTLIEFGKKLKRNFIWGKICFYAGIIGFPFFMVFVLQSPFLLILAGNTVLGIIIDKFFDFRRSIIIDQARKYCEEQKIDFTQSK